MQDFTGVTSFPLVFNAGDDVICLAVSITNDLTSEPTETFFVGIDGTSSTATVTILDDDDVVGMLLLLLFSLRVHLFLLFLLPQ